MRTRRSLIRSPLEWHWQVGSGPVPHPAIPVLAERGGTQLRTPRPVLLVDTREQNLFDFSRFEGWFAGIEKKPLKLGDYSVAGLEDVCVVERKDLPDLIHSLTAERSVFVNRLRRMSRYPHRLLVVHCRIEPGEVSISPRGREPEPRHPVPDCGACRTPSSIPMYGNSRTRRGGGSVVSVPGSPLPLAGN
jgi:hypothetical protein